MLSQPNILESISTIRLPIRIDTFAGKLWNIRDPDLEKVLENSVKIVEVNETNNHYNVVLNTDLFDDDVV